MWIKLSFVSRISFLHHPRNVEWPSSLNALCLVWRKQVQSHFLYLKLNWTLHNWVHIISTRYSQLSRRYLGSRAQLVDHTKYLQTNSLHLEALITSSFGQNWALLLVTTVEEWKTQHNDITKLPNNKLSFENSLTSLWGCLLHGPLGKCPNLLN